MNSHVSSPQAVEAELLRQTEELTGGFRNVCVYALEGGRRLRSSLLLDASQQSGHRAIRAAASIEMLHAATLLQDDIFDEGITRRGRTAAHVRFGKAAAILASDWLLVSALETAAEIDLRLFRFLAHAATSMTQAEAKEFEPVAFESLQEAQVYGEAIAQGKTAVLFAAATYAAAILQGLSTVQCDRWQALGAEMGQTYQLVDDCVDFYVQEEHAGKSVDHDLSAGCPTMPVLLALFRLERQGISLPMQALRRGSLTVLERHKVREGVCSAEVKNHMHHILQQRWTMHRSQAQACGFPESAVQAWTAELLPRVALCFPEEPPSTVTGHSVYAEATWQNGQPCA